MQLELRKYQQLILSQARLYNTIAYLPTGTGKTLISCALIRERLERLRIARENVQQEWPKVIIFIAPTRTLVAQQVEYIKVHAHPVKVLCAVGSNETSNVRNNSSGESIAFTEKEIASWKHRVQSYEVIVTTPETLRKLIEMNVFPVSSIDLLILDECHHAVANDPLGKLCDAIFRPLNYSFDDPSSDPCRPNSTENLLIFAMTASPIAGKFKESSLQPGSQGIEETVTLLEQRLHCRFFYPTKEFLTSLQEYRPKPKTFAIEFQSLLPVRCEIEFIHFIDRLEKSIKLKELYTKEQQLLYDVVESFDPQGAEYAYYLPFLQGFDVIVASVGKERKDARIISQLNLTLLKEMLNQMIEVLKSGGIYCGLRAFALLLRSKFFQPEEADEFTQLVLGTSDSTLETLTKKRKREEKDENRVEDGTQQTKSASHSSWSEHALTLSERFHSHQLTHRTIQLERLPEIRNKLISYLKKDVKRFELLSDQPFCLFYTLLEMLYAFGRVCSAQDCEQAIEHLQVKLREREDKESSNVKGTEETTNQPPRENILSLCIATLQLAVKKQKFAEMREKISGYSFHQCSDLLGIATACDALLGTFPPQSLMSILSPSASTTSPLIATGYFTKKLSCLLQLLSLASLCNKDPKEEKEEISSSDPPQEEKAFSHRIEQYLVVDENVERIALENKVFLQSLFEALQTDANDSNAFTPSTSSAAASAQSSKKKYSNAIIVFCKLRLMGTILKCLLDDIGRAIHHVEAMNSVQMSEVAVSITNPSVFLYEAEAFDGRSSLSVQKNVLTRLRKGLINLLFVTNVAQEGIDIPSCNVIVNYDSPETLIGFIQRRGRARSLSSLVLNLLQHLPPLSSTLPALNKQQYQEYLTLQQFFLQEIRTEKVLQAMLLQQEEERVEYELEEGEEMENLPASATAIALSHKKMTPRIPEEVLTQLASNTSAYSIQDLLQNPQTGMKLDWFTAKTFLDQYCSHFIQRWMLYHRASRLPLRVVMKLRDAGNKLAEEAEEEEESSSTGVERKMMAMTMKGGGGTEDYMINFPRYLFDHFSHHHMSTTDWRMQLYLPDLLRRTFDDCPIFAITGPQSLLANLTHFQVKGLLAIQAIQYLLEKKEIDAECFRFRSRGPWMTGEVSSSEKKATFDGSREEILEFQRRRSFIAEMTHLSIPASTVNIFQDVQIQILIKKVSDSIIREMDPASTMRSQRIAAEAGAEGVGTGEKMMVEENTIDLHHHPHPSSPSPDSSSLSTLAHHPPLQCSNENSLSGLFFHNSQTSAHSKTIEEEGEDVTATSPDNGRSSSSLLLTPSPLFHLYGVRLVSSKKEELFLQDQKKTTTFAASLNTKRLSQLEAIESMVFCFLQPFSALAMDGWFELFVKGLLSTSDSSHREGNSPAIDFSKDFFRLEYLGSRCFTLLEMSLIQIFHKSIVSLHPFLLPAEGERNRDLTVMLNGQPQTPPQTATTSAGSSAATSTLSSSFFFPTDRYEPLEQYLSQIYSEAKSIDDLIEKGIFFEESTWKSLSDGSYYLVLPAPALSSSADSITKASRLEQITTEYLYQTALRSILLMNNLLNLQENNRQSSSLAYFYHRADQISFPTTDTNTSISANIRSRSMKEVRQELLSLVNDTVVTSNGRNLFCFEKYAPERLESHLLDAMPLNSTSSTIVKEPKNCSTRKIHKRRQQLQIHNYADYYRKKSSLIQSFLHKLLMQSASVTVILKSPDVSAPSSSMLLVEGEEEEGGREDIATTQQVEGEKEAENRYSYEKKNGEVEAMTGKDQYDPAYMFKAYPITGKLTLINMLQSPEQIFGVATAASTASVASSVSLTSEVQLLPHFCAPIGSLSFLNMAMAFPSLNHRFQSIFLAQEVYDRYFCPALAMIPQLIKVEPAGKKMGEMAMDVIHSMEDTSLNESSGLDVSPPVTKKRKLEEPPVSPLISVSSSQPLPSSSSPFAFPINLEDILRAMTPRRSMECIDSERLEFLGDAFLRYAATLHIFLASPSLTEGEMTQLRRTFIGNHHLKEVALQTGLSEYLRVHHFTRGLEEYLEYPPGYQEIAPTENEIKQSYTWQSSLRNVNIFMPAKQSDDKKKKKANAENTNVDINTGNSDTDTNTAEVADQINEGSCSSSQYEKVWINTKSVADITEAILGVCVLSEHSEGFGFAMLYTLQILPLEKEQSPPICFQYQPTKHSLSIRHQGYLDATKAVLASLPSEDNPTMRTLPVSKGLSDLTIREIEERLGYTFHHKELLSLAFTHTLRSASGRFIANYQRLEFLGDAILDYLIIRYLFHLPARTTPEEPEQQPKEDALLWGKRSRDIDDHQRFLSMRNPWNEGELTLLKLWFTTNEMLCRLCYHCGFYQYLQSESIDLMWKLSSLHQLQMQKTALSSTEEEEDEERLEEGDDEDDDEGNRGKREEEEIEGKEASKRKRLDMARLVAQQSARLARINRLAVDSSSPVEMNTTTTVTAAAALSGPEEEEAKEIEEDPDVDEYIHMKILADLFEALIGAIYIDSEHNLTIVQEVLTGLGVFDLSYTQLQYSLQRYIAMRDAPSCSLLQ